MTTLSSAVLLGCIHASIVALAALIARACLPRRWAGGRATIGVVGLGCVLARHQSGRAAVAGHSIEIVETGRGVDSESQTRRAGADPTRIHGTTRRPPARRCNCRLSGSGDWEMDSNRRRPRRGGSSTDWRAWAFVAVLAGATIGVGRLAVAYRHLAVAVREPAGGRRGGRRHGRKVPELLWLPPANRDPGDRRGGQRGDVRLVAAGDPFAKRLVRLVGRRAGRRARHEVAHVRVRGFRAADRRAGRRRGLLLSPVGPLRGSAIGGRSGDRRRSAGAAAASARVYVRGLAGLALRYHRSIQNERAWSSVSLMPRSSDFLARRLEMLRVKQNSTDRGAAGSSRVARACRGDRLPGGDPVARPRGGRRRPTAGPAASKPPAV